MTCISGNCRVNQIKMVPYWCFVRLQYKYCLHLAISYESDITDKRTCTCYYKFSINSRS